MRIIGTLFDSYILVEYADNLMLIDQQAVHERVMFDRMMKALDQHRCGQEMLVPMIVSLTRREQQLLDEHARELADIGLVVEPFGENEVSIRSIPMILGQPQAAGLLRDIIDQLEMSAAWCRWKAARGDFGAGVQAQRSLRRTPERHRHPRTGQPRGG